MTPEIRRETCSVSWLPGFQIGTLPDRAKGFDNPGCIFFRTSGITGNKNETNDYEKETN
jgi:hypothetical protein